MAEAKLVIAIEEKDAGRSAPGPALPAGSATPLPTLPPLPLPPVGMGGAPGRGYPVLPPIATPPVPPAGGLPALSPTPTAAPAKAAAPATAAPVPGRVGTTPATYAALPRLPDPMRFTGFAGDAGVGLQRAGRAAEGLADNSIGPALKGAVDTAAAGLSKLGPYGAAAAAGLKVLEAGVSAVGDTMNAFVARGRELAGYNSSLAGATAGADVRTLMADVREANDLGPQLAQLIETQSKMEASLRELLLPIKEFLIDVLNGMMRTLLEMGVGVLEGINKLTFGQLESVVKLLERIRAILDDKSPGGDMLADLLKQADKFISPELPAGARGRPNPAASPVLAVPLVTMWRP
ncbi:hypothetical protein [Gemmata sp.]|uniref:hypothetical protein n=1 Tax=Gemmata sp. TaxID=1914242 RepID=UPI003F713F92